MAYFRSTALQGLGWFMPQAPQQPAPPIEMAEEFVGNVNALPICPKTDANGWCRKYVGGSAVKMAVNVAPTTTVKPASTTTTATASAAGSTVTAAVQGILSALTSPVKTSAPVPVVASAARPGMSTTTKVALAGGAVLLAVLISRR